MRLFIILMLTAITLYTGHYLTLFSWYHEDMDLARGLMGIICGARGVLLLGELDR